MQEVRLLSRTGVVKWIGALLFAVGVVLCLFPFVSRCFVNANQMDDAMGNLSIPKIKVELPIYADVKEEMLEQGVGHIKSTALAGSGVGTHCVMAGHRGLPGAQLLARLGELEAGDVFLVSVEGLLLSYQVCEIQVIRPEETNRLVAQKGRELLSLVTCTPYGINTHRLVVTGERINK